MNVIISLIVSNALRMSCNSYKTYAKHLTLLTVKKRQYHLFVFSPASARSIKFIGVFQDSGFGRLLSKNQ